jgi:interferon-induced GTP-binding protein Mx1
LIDILRSKGLDKHIELPQVAVMGDTSTGKSSLLSALSGIVFPASDKLTTRCPTQMIMKYSDKFKGNVHLKRYSTNKRENETVLGNIGEATQVIESLTQKLIDEGQFISNDSIVITLEGPDLPNLTLTDLPGWCELLKIPKMGTLWKVQRN